jgi:FMN phosphatase YigB (HAD superfamily)
MLRAVVFDLYETLVTQTGVDVPRAGALGDALGLEAGAYRKHWKQLRPLVLRGRLTFEQALTQVGSELGVHIPPERVRRACDDRIRANTTVFQQIDPDLLALTRELARRGLRLATISNCMAEDVVAWPDSAFAPYFSSAVFSFRAGAVKPEAGIYLDAIAQLNVTAGEALYVGDGGDDELAGAERAGLRAAQATWFVSRASYTTIPVVANTREVMHLVAAG